MLNGIGVLLFTAVGLMWVIFPLLILAIVLTTQAIVCLGQDVTTPYSALNYVGALSLTPGVITARISETPGAGGLLYAGSLLLVVGHIASLVTHHKQRRQRTVQG